jgi:hypothetical protein
MHWGITERISGEEISKFAGHRVSTTEAVRDVDHGYFTIRLRFRIGRCWTQLH